MKHLVKLAAVTLFLLVSSKALAEGPIDSGRELFFPDFDFKYVQFLPEGHLVKNKQRYNKLAWQVWESKHFEIFTYGMSKELAGFYLTEAEKVYEEYSRRTKMNSFAEKIKVIVYNSVRDYQETNMLSDLVPEGLGGFTEMSTRKRVVLAYRDSPAGFRHVIRHELYHRYQADFIKKDLPSFWVWRFQFPLWFAEGSAEYFSTTWNADSELTMRDAYLNNYLAPATELDWQPSDLVYHGGHFVVKFLAERYHDKGDVASNILRASKDLPFAKAFEQVTGESLKKFNQELNFCIENRYHHLRTKRDLVDDAKVLTSGPLNLIEVTEEVFGADKSRGGVLLDARGDFFITKTIRNGRILLVLNWSDGSKVYSKKIVEDGRLNNAVLHGMGIETSLAFGFPESGAVFGNDYEVIYSIDTGGRDEIRIQGFSFDKKEKKFKLGKARAYQPKGFPDVRTPIRINENELAFIGRGQVFAEVFLFNLKTGEVKKLSSLKRNCHGLTYSRYLNALVTAVENEKTDSCDLAIYKLDEGSWKLLTETKENELEPKFSVDGKKMFYVSDQGLVYNIYLLDCENQIVNQLTDVKVGVFKPAWRGADGLLFNGISNQKLRVQVAPLQVREAKPAVVLNSATKLLDSDVLEKEFSERVPSLADWTVMDTVFSKDKSKALFVINRKLSLSLSNQGVPDLGFCLVDKESGKVITFSRWEVDDIDLFENAQFLAGTKILLRNRIRGKEELFVYDWQTKAIDTLDKGKFFGFRITILGIGEGKKAFTKVSPDGKFLLVFRDGVFSGKLKLYDVLAGNFVNSQFYKDVTDTFFLDEKSALIIAWVKKQGEFGPKENAVVWFDLAAREGKDLGVKLDDGIISAHSFSENKNTVLVTELGKDGILFANKNKSFNVWLLDPVQNTARQILKDLPSVKVMDVSENQLTLETRNSFGLKRTIRINPGGEVETVDENLPAVSNSFNALAPVTPLNEQILNFDPNIPKKIRSPKLLPRKYIGQAGGTFSTHEVNAYVALLALDELNDQAFNAVVAIRGKHFGFANVQYYHFPSGQSVGFLYWDSDWRSKLELELRKNIFLDRFLNWDFALKEQQLKVDYSFYQMKLWQTKVGTTFSLNETTWDPHGPRSGNAVFSGIEVGLRNGHEYQATDLNLDARGHLPITARSSFALRFAGGTSLGPHPTSFIWGGNQTLRGIPLFSQSGNSYVLQSAELRMPVMDFLVGKFSNGLVDKSLGHAIRFYDIRGGFYGDVGDLWYYNANTHRRYLDHVGFKLQYSAGYFLNVPLMFAYGSGFNIRFNKGFYGKKDWNVWMSYDL